MRMYRNMQSRVRGIQKDKKHLYENKYLLPRDEFYAFANSCAEFHEMFYVWENSNYERRLAPTVDRINSSLGYSIGNIRWLTHSENSRLGALSQVRKFDKLK